MFRIATVVLATFAVAGSAFATDMIVAPGQSIQGAINVALNGDRVLVQPGTYVENIVIAGKAIEVLSIGGPSVTKVNGSALPDSVITCGGVGLAVRIAGFTVTGGVGKGLPGTFGQKRYGGGIYASGLVLIESCILENNTTFFGFQEPGKAYGGGAYLFGDSMPLMRNCIVRNNVAFTGGGVDGGRLEHCVIETNTGTRGGGVADVAEIRSCRIRGNSGYEGGGIYVSTPVAPTCFDVVVEGNNGAVGGGAYVLALAVVQGTLTNLTNCSFTNNTATVRGGGLALELRQSGGGPPPTQTHVVSMRWCAFTQNVAPPLAGMGISLETKPSTAAPLLCKATIDHCSFDTDDAVMQGTSHFVTNSAFVNNVAPLTLTGGTIQVDSCIVPGTYPGSGCFTANPGFFNGANGDFHLVAGSPALDLGVATANGVVAFDFENDGIVGAPDIGADERAPHLYLVGRSAPGSTVDLRVVGPPGAQATMFLSLTKLTTPIPTIAGPFGLGFPISFDLPVGTIPASGVISASATIPASSPLFATAYAQVVLQIGGTAQLTNVMPIVVE